LHKDFTKIDSLNAKLNLLTLSYYFPDIKNTYQELVATGQLSLIEDLDITTRIIDFYLFTNDNAITFTKNNDNVFYKQVSPFLNQLIHVNLDESFLEDDELNLLEVDNNITNYINIELQKPKNKLTLLNAIKTNILIQEGNYYLIEETLILGNELTKQIDKELDSIN